MEFPTNPIPFSGMLPPPKVNQRTQSFSHTFRSDSDAPTERTIVLKVGSSSLTRENGAVNISTMSSLVELITNLRAKDYSVILVSSGAVSVGCQALKLKTRPKDLITKQAVAAVGQGSLVRLYHELFSVLGGQIAQVLLSRSNLSLEHHYLNSLNTFKELLRLNVIPIVNENDTLAVDELHFGDNDTLSALVASLVRAEWLFLLTDVDALYTSNPNKDPSAKAIHVVKSMKDLASLGVDVGDNSPMLPIHDVEKTSSNTSDHPADDADDDADADADTNANIPSSTPPTQQSGQWGTGGMSTKLEAAKIATTAGVRTAICSTRNLDHIMMMLDGCMTVGTQFSPAQNVIVGRKKWIAQGLQPIGSIIIDAGACLALQKKTSLFAAGLVSIKGRFPANCCIRIVTQSGVEIGRGLSNYSSKELSIIKGVSSKDIAKKLNKALNNISERVDYPEAIIDRDNIALIYTEEFDSIVLGRDISSKDIASSSGEDGEKHCRMEAIMEKATHDSQLGKERERGHISSNVSGTSSVPSSSSPIPATCPINQIHKSSKLTNTVEEYADQAKDEFNYNVEKINMLSLQSNLPDSPQLHTSDSVAVTTPILTELGVLGHTHNYFANRVNSECTEYSKFSQKSERSDYQEACESHENSCAESHEEAGDSVESNGSNDGHDSNDSNDSNDFSHPKPKTKTVITSKSPIDKNKSTKTIDITASKYGMY